VTGVQTCALPICIRRLLRGRFLAFFVGLYANRLNRRWQREEQDYLRKLRHEGQALPA
jgi:hypothetical protein